MYRAVYEEFNTTRRDTTMFCLYAPISLPFFFIELTLNLVIGFEIFKTDLIVLNIEYCLILMQFIILNLQTGKCYISIDATIECSINAIFICKI